VLISLSFHFVLSSDQVLAHKLLHKLSFFHPVAEINILARLCNVNAEVFWFITIENKKWCPA
jgi:hypothetical protein